MAKGAGDIKEDTDTISRADNVESLQIEVISERGSVICATSEKRTRPLYPRNTRDCYEILRGRFCKLRQGFFFFFPVYQTLSEPFPPNKIARFLRCFEKQLQHHISIIITNGKPKTAERAGTTEALKHL